MNQEPGLDSEQNQPTTTNILRVCPRYRVLVVGKSGVGKSTLINNIFHVNIAKVSSDHRGTADINCAITDAGNPLFELHDSVGLERGNQKELDDIMKFLEERSREGLELKDRVHVVWLCIAIPFDGSRIFEEGTEKLIAFTKERQIPIIVVFTKYDLLVVHRERRWKKKHPHASEHESRAEGEKEADKFFKDKCVTELGDQAPCVKISDLNSTANAPPETSRINAENLLAALVAATQNLQTGDIWTIGAMAQRVNVKANIEASIEIGMRHYWPALTGSTLGDWKFFQVLDVIHTDIVNTWNFLGGDTILNGDDFRKFIRTLAIVEELRDNMDQGATRSDGSISDANDLRDFLEPLSEAFKMLIPAGYLFYKGGLLVVRRYRQVSNNKRIALEYIAHLTLILDALFWDRSGKRPVAEVRVEELGDACHGYTTAKVSQVRKTIYGLATKNLWQNKDAISNGVRNLIGQHCNSPLNSDS